jgi:hypothetical protein
MRVPFDVWQPATVPERSATVLRQSVRVCAACVLVTARFLGEPFWNYREVWRSVAPSTTPPPPRPDTVRGDSCRNTAVRLVDLEHPCPARLSTTTSTRRISSSSRACFHPLANRILQIPSGVPNLRANRWPSAGRCDRTTRRLRRADLLVLGGGRGEHPRLLGGPGTTRHAWHDTWADFLQT